MAPTSDQIECDVLSSSITVNSATRSNGPPPVQWSLRPLEQNQLWERRPKFSAAAYLVSGERRDRSPPPPPPWRQPSMSTVVDRTPSDSSPSADGLPSFAASWSRSQSLAHSTHFQLGRIRPWSYRSISLQQRRQQHQACFIASRSILLILSAATVILGLMTASPH